MAGALSRSPTKSNKGQYTTAKTISKDFKVNISQRHLWKLIIVGLLFHLIQLASIFDVYFRSPLIHGSKPVKMPKPAPAKRLVLFVGDGLRADTIFAGRHDKASLEMSASNPSRRRMEEQAPLAPFLLEKATKDGVWGISHTRVPTESRPGHIAMIAGFYEDPSAVTKGWKSNPVDYDHLLAQASHAWSFGAPEIVDLFTAGPNVHPAHYPAEMIDFGKDPRLLDQWSFDRLQDLFERAKVDEDLKQNLSEDGVFIFVHLLGLDTNGHAHKPASPEYRSNLAYIDAGIQDAVFMIEEFFQNDGKTAFVFTADHGMSDHGSHGDGDPDNTRTPLIAWGAGIDRPSLGNQDQPDHIPGLLPDLVSLWRRDVEQAGIVPLCAGLLGIAIPVNSVGVAPVKLLGTDPAHKRAVLLANAKQMLETYRRWDQRKRLKEPFYKEYPKMPVSVAETRLNTFITAGEGSEKDIEDFIREADAGATYLHQYDQKLLLTIITLGYIGWMIYAITSRLTVGGSHSDVVRKNPFLTASFIVFAAGVFGFMAKKSAPVQYYIYCIFPLLFWHAIFQRSSNIVYWFKRQPFITFAALAMAGLGGLQLLVVAFSWRFILSVINLVICSYYAFQEYPRSKRRFSLWILAGLTVSQFPLMPSIKIANQTLFLAGVATIILVSIAWRLFLAEFHKPSLGAMTLRLASIALAGWLAIESDLRHSGKAQVSIMQQTLCWIILGSSAFKPLIFFGISSGRQDRQMHAQARLYELFLAFAPGIVLLSVSYETLFYAAFSTQLGLWYESVKAYTKSTSKITSSSQLNWHHFWLVYCFMFFIELSFFGTGNFASISSFNLSSVYRFLTVFQPFVMTGLLVYKLLVPFCFLSAVFGAIARCCQNAVISAASKKKRDGDEKFPVLVEFVPPISLFILVAAGSDVSTLNFLFSIKTVGSWLEIGTSISQFVIASLYIIVGLVMFVFSNLFLAGTTHFE